MARVQKCDRNQGAISHKSDDRQYDQDDKGHLHTRVFSSLNTLGWQRERNQSLRDSTPPVILLNAGNLGNVWEVPCHQSVCPIRPGIIFALVGVDIRLQPWPMIGSLV